MILIAALSAGALAQTDSSAPATPPAAANGTDIPPAAAIDTPSDSTSSSTMAVPSIVSGASSSLAFTPEMERSNYLRGGASVTAAYEDHILSSTGTSTGTTNSDLAYTIGPNVSLDMTRSRSRFDFFYSPGFTIFQRHSSLDQSSHSMGTSFAYRLSPHVTFTAQDSLTKSSSSYGSFDYSPTGVPNPLQSPNLALISPVENTLANTATAGLSYQISRDDMVGVTGNYFIERYLNGSRITGLYDSTTVGGGGYYSHRFANRNYLGANYQFEEIKTATLNVKTTVNSFSGFYTLYLKPNLSLTAFGGPQHTSSSGGPLPSQSSWSPSGGGSVSWQGQETSFGASFSRRVTDGGGLQGAVRANIANASFRAQLTKTYSGSVGADYTTSTVLNPVLSGNFGASSGHSLSERASVSRNFGEHLSGGIAYSHTHQSYSNGSLGLFPNQNLVSVSLSYQFERPLGR